MAIENTAAARSAIADTDVAKGTAILARYQVLDQTQTAALMYSQRDAISSLIG